MTKSLEKWWAITANYKSIHLGKARRKHLWEQIIFLVPALTEVEATKVAHKTAKLKEHTYQTANGEQVVWKLIEILKVQELIDRELKLGMEVGWKFFERVDKLEAKSGD